MVKKVTRKKSSTPLQREIVKLIKEKERRLKTKADLTARKIAMEEIGELKRDIARLESAGTKKEIAKQVAKKLGKDVGSFGWKGLKIAGKFVKNVVEAEARAQDRERARSKPKTRARPKRKLKPKTRARPKPKPKRRKKR